MGFFCAYEFYFYICKKITKMNIKSRLTIAMWALPLIFILIGFGTTIEVKAIGFVLLVIQMILWGKLLSEVKEVEKNDNES